ncbi:MAG: transglycosylase domain-containing protein [Bacteroidales bacterium]|nr:transglycosylase domain-containing protein [Bacteroidales bacterium]
MTHSSITSFFTGLYQRLTKALAPALSAISARWAAVKPYVLKVAKPLYFPSDNPNPKKRWLINIGKVLGHIIFLTVLLIALVYMGAFGHIPTNSELRAINTADASTIFSSDNIQMGRIYKQNRISVDSTGISANVINALIATEDSRFFEHNGVDAQSALRVIFKTFLLFDFSQGGGSTISQQLAKNLYPRKSLGPLTYPVAKIKEIIIAQRLEEVYSKSEILNLYLNTVPFGENVYGIEAASQRFFSRKAKWLEPPAAATLVGMLAANTAYNPHKHPEQSLARRNVVLSRMAKAGYIDSTKLETFQAAPLGLKYNRVDNESGIAIFFRYMVAQEAQHILDDLYGEDTYNIYTDGLEIHTTLNSRLQQYAESAVSAHLTAVQKAFNEQWKGKEPWGERTSIYTKAYERSERYRYMKRHNFPADTIEARMNRAIEMTAYTANGTETVVMSPADSVRAAITVQNAGFLAVNPSNGDVLAWVGGINRHLSQTDHVYTRRQVGSTFKPIVYATALENGVSPTTYIENVRRSYGNWSPGNSDGKYGGWYSLKGALSKSLNTASAYLINQTGPDAVVSMAHRMGIESDIPSVPSIALGTAEISLYEMVKAYQAFATAGYVNNLRTITSIKDHSGKVLYRAESSSPECVMSEATAIYVNDMMKAVVDSGTARSLRSAYKLTGEIAGKTGTTQNSADGWFICCTPGIVAGAWVGSDTPAIHFRTGYYGQGAYMALPIVGRFLSSARKSSFVSGSFPEPLDEEMAVNMTFPLHCDHEPDQSVLFDRALNHYMGLDTLSVDRIDIQRPVRVFFRNIFRNLFGDED